MKKQTFLRLTAVTSALCLTAFALRSHSATANYYWFPLDPSSGFPQAITTLFYQDTDPADCGNFPANPYCSAAYTTFTVDGSGDYLASGTLVKVDYAREEHPKK